MFKLYENGEAFYQYYAEQFKKNIDRNNQNYIPNTQKSGIITDIRIGRNHICTDNFQTAVDYISNPKNIQYQADIGHHENGPTIFLLDEAGHIFDIYSGDHYFQENNHIYQFPPLDQRQVAYGYDSPEIVQNEEAYYKQLLLKRDVNWLQIELERNFENIKTTDLLFETVTLIRNEKNYKTMFFDVINLLKNNDNGSTLLEQYMPDLQKEMMLSLKEFKDCEKLSRTLNSQTQEKPTELKKMLNYLRNDKKFLTFFLKT
jgi:cupin superfamily acireductone dioxygenase involved in methionine salvage